MEEILKMLIPAVIGVVGVLVGGIATYFGNLKIKTVELEHQIKKEKNIELRKVSSLFVSEANLAGIRSFESKANAVEKFERVHALTAQLELIASESIVKKAEAVTLAVMDLYIENKTDRVTLAEARKEFVKQVKIELNTLA